MRTHRSDLGDYLRARRNVCRPEDVGVERGEGRRVPGLRRDEVARRASISPEYYLRLEQGRVSAPSPQVVHALADALLLDDVARVYLSRLAFGSLPPSPRPSPLHIAGIMRQWAGSPAYMTDSNRDVVASNDMNVMLSGGRHMPGVNMMTEIFDPELSVRADAQWDALRRAAVGSFRFDADPRASRARRIVSDLLPDPAFAQLWERHDVTIPTSYDIAAVVPGFGSVPVHVHNLRVPALRGYQLTVYTAPVDSAAQEWFAGLRAAASTRAA